MRTMRWEDGWRTAHTITGDEMSGECGVCGADRPYVEPGQEPVCFNCENIELRKQKKALLAALEAVVDQNRQVFRQGKLKASALADAVSIARSAIAKAKGEDQ